MPITAGSTPATAVATTRASGFRPSSRARSASTSSTADAPSLMPELFPAVTEPPSRLNAGFSLARASAEVSARGCSSRLDGRGLALPTGDLDGDDLVVEPAGLDRGDRALLALERERVLALAVDAVALRDVLGGLAHRVRVVHLGELRVQEPPAERGVLELARATVPGRGRLGHDVRRPRHRFHAAADEHVAVADGDRVCGRVDRLQPGPAQPIDGQATDLDRETGKQHGHPRDVAVVLARLVGAAEDDVLDEGRVDTGPIDDGSQHERREVVRPHGRQRAAVAADGRPYGLDDPGLAEWALQVSHGRIVGVAARRGRWDSATPAQGSFDNASLTIDSSAPAMVNETSWVA